MGSTPEGDEPPSGGCPFGLSPQAELGSCCFRLRCLQRASPIPAAVVPKRMSVAGSGTGLGEGTELTKPNALTENRKECDPGVSPNKKESEPELKLSQLLRPEQGLAKFETRVALSRAKEKEVDEDMNSL
jgi:hypothetical protein